MSDCNKCHEDYEIAKKGALVEYAIALALATAGLFVPGGAGLAGLVGEGHVAARVRGAR